MSAWLRTSVFLLLVAAVALIALGSESRFYLSSGSDSNVEIFTPAVLPKFIAWIVVVAALAFALYGTRRGALLRWGIGVAGILLLAFATHALVLNYKRGVIEEYWLACKFDRARYDASEGVRADWHIRKRALGIELQHQRDGATVFLLTGFPPFRVDPGPALGE